MSDQIPTFNYVSYSAGVQLLAQQMMSKTLTAVTVKRETGKKVAVDRVGAVTMQEKTGRAAEIPVVDTPHDRRWLTNKNFYMRDWIDEFDKLDILNDPTNAYTQAFAAAGGRRIDKIVIDAALGTAYAGEEGTVATALPAAQQIAAGGTGFTLAKVRQAKRMLLTNNAMMPGDSLHVFYTARQEEDFINTSEVKSSDFNRDKVMVNGELDYFYGAYYHMVEDDGGIGAILPKSGTTRSCVMMLKSGVCLNLRKDVYGRVDFDQARESYQVMAGLSGGAVRVEEVKVVQIDVLES